MTGQKPGIRAIRTSADQRCELLFYCPSVTPRAFVVLCLAHGSRPPESWRQGSNRIMARVNMACVPMRRQTM